MPPITKWLIIAGLGLVLVVNAQSPLDKPSGANDSFKLPVRPSDVRIAQRAAELLDSPQKWNRGFVGDCATDATGKLTLYCSLDKAAREVSGELDDRSAVRQESRAVIAFLPSTSMELTGTTATPR